jgi:oligopeptidase B
LPVFLLRDNIAYESPKAKKHELFLEKHGDRRSDPYYWLNDRTNPEVIDYLQQENAYTEAVMQPLLGFRETLFAEMKSRIAATEISARVHKNGFYYYHRYEENKEYPIYCRVAQNSEEEAVLLDVNALAAGHAYYQIGRVAVSEDNRVLCFAEDTVSRRIYTLRFKHATSDQYYPEQINGTSGEVIWANDHNTIFYVLRDPETLRAYRVMKHKLGTSVDLDELVYEETDETFLTGLRKSLSGRFIFIESEATLSTETWLLDADAPDKDPELFQGRKEKHEYAISHQDSRFFILSNFGAMNFKLCVCSLSCRNMEEWVEVVPERSDVLLEGVVAFEKYIVLTERFQGLNRIRILTNNREDYHVTFPDEAYMVYVGANYDYNGTRFRLNYSSPSTPPSEFDFTLEDKSLNVVYEKVVLGGFSKNNYEVKRLHCPGDDGRQIPITIVYHRERVKTGTPSPLLLYGYGSYGYSLDPYFSIDRLSLLDRGVIFAMAHIRGGQEMGRSWYEEGKLLRKMNTFTDFINCAAYLIANRYTSANQLLAMGGSAGGLLMGAVANMRPDLFKAMVAAVPFVDVVTTMLDDRIPLTTFEYDEWGNPNDPEYYFYMKSYSPYDNIKNQSYPAILITAGLHDSQVQYWEPAKYAARLRELQASSEPILLYTEMDAGHSGASGRFERYRETALIYSFLLDQVGLADKC